MSALILTPALVCRYLLASGWADAPRGFMTKRGEQVGLFATMTPFELDHEIEKIARSERVSRSEMAARLGMLASAEMFIDGASSRVTWDCKALDMIESIGLTPDAWEKVRGV